MKKETQEKYIGKTFGVIQVLGIDHETYDKQRQVKRTYFKVFCKRCKQYSTLRADSLFVFGRKGKQDRKSCKLCYADLQKEIADNKYAATRHFRRRIGSIKGNAKCRKIEFNLSDDDVNKLINSSCFYCGVENCDGIDRIDSKKGYELNNCVPCCKTCNLMKNKFTTDVFFDKIKRIYILHHNESSTTISKESTLQANGSGSGGLLTV